VSAYPLPGIEALIYFAIARVVYSIVERRDLRFLLLDVSLSSAFASLYLFPFDRLVPAASAGLVFLAYMITAILPYSLVRKAPAEASGVVGISESRSHVWLGIINTSWLSIMGLTSAVLLMWQQLGIVTGPFPPAGRSTEYYEAAIHQCFFFLEAVINAAFVLGTGLGVCMAILWSGEIWRKRDPLSKNQYRAHTLASVKMVVAFLVVVGAALVWVVAPLYERASRLQEMLK